MAIESAAVRLVPAVDRAMRVLALLEAEGRPLGISDLARRLDASKGSVRDLLETLRRHGALERDESTKHYRLGPRLVRFGAAAEQWQDLPSLARPLLRQLSAETGETSLLLVRRGERLLILEKADAIASDFAIRISANVGQRIPLLAGACAKVVLAYADADERDDALARLPRFTSRTQQDRDQFAADLDGVRSRGYAIDDQEYLEGVRAAAAGVLNAHGSLAGIILAVGLASTLTERRLEEVGLAVCSVARRLSAALGARPQTAHPA